MTAWTRRPRKTVTQREKLEKHWREKAERIWTAKIGKSRGGSKFEHDLAVEFFLAGAKAGTSTECEFCGRRRKIRWGVAGTEKEK